MNKEVREMVNFNRNDIVLETRNLEKHFGGIMAVDNIDMKLYRNEILAIVGDNGAGKSTLIKTITGVNKKDGGDIFIEGKKAEIFNTKDAKHYGIEVVYQDKGLVQTLDASTNLFLGREILQKNLFGRFFRFLDNIYMIKETEKLLIKIGVSLKNLKAPINSLSGGQQQSVAVGRAIYWGGRILIFDEPTNNLGVREQQKTLEHIRNIRDNYKNVSIIVITHNLYHVFELCDRILVLRNGKVIGERLKDQTTINEISTMITGLSN